MTAASAPPVSTARFGIGEVVRHRLLDFRGVVFDIDPVFANSEEWYEAIPAEIRPSKDQPFYHLLAENNEGSYVAYVSQQNLVADEEDEPVDHPAAIGALVVELLAAQQQRPGHSPAGDQRQAPDRPRVHGKAVAGGRDGELRGRRGDAQVTGDGHLCAGSDGRPVHRGDDRLGGGEPPRQ